MKDEKTYNTPTINYKDMAIENADFISSAGVTGSFVQPPFDGDCNLPYFGIMSIPANTPQDVTYWISACTLWSLETTIKVSCPLYTINHTTKEYASWHSFPHSYLTKAFYGADRFYGPRYYGMGRGSGMRE